VGFVYDKAAILQHIQRSQCGPAQSVHCPVAGTGHRITAAELRPATAVIRAKGRAGRGGQRATQPVEAVADLELD